MNDWVSLYSGLNSEKPIPFINQFWTNSIFLKCNFVKCNTIWQGKVLLTALSVFLLFLVTVMHLFFHKNDSIIKFQNNLLK